MRIDATGNDELVAGIDGEICFDIDLLADHRDSFAVNKNICCIVIDRGYNAAGFD